jgi:cytidylate kinase
LINIITIDGPSGVGKGTISEYLAMQLNWNYLNSGALYRSIAWVANRESLTLIQNNEIIRASKKLKFSLDKQELNIEYQNYDIASLIYTEEVAKNASKIASDPKLRASIVDIQRSFKMKPGLIAEGRDMGSIIFPESKLKIYLTASSETRAQRRYNQLKDRGFNVSLPALIKDLDARDMRDRERDNSPLVIPKGASVIETDNLKINQVKELTMKMVNKTYGTNISRVI